MKTITLINRLITTLIIMIGLSMGPNQLAIAAEKIIPNTDAAIESSILQEINQYRIGRGLQPFKMNALMVNEAKKHSRDMAEHKMPFGHLAFNQRIERLYKQIKDPRAGAENIAYAYKSSEVVKKWLSSPGHRRNINGNYNLTGIGIAHDERGKLYYTQIFLKAG